MSKKKLNEHISPKHYKLDAEEQELMDWLDDAVEKNTLVSVPNVKKEIRRITQIARANSHKIKPVIKKKAA